MIQKPDTTDTPSLGITTDHLGRVIAVGNQKGGVCKTSTACHVGHALAERGRKVLLWDLDANHGTTLHFGIKGEAFAGSLEILLGSEKPDDVLISPGDDEDVELPVNLHVIASSRKLEYLEKQLDNWADPKDLLVEPVARVKPHFDYIFLDTAPNLTGPTMAAYKAADWLLLAAEPSPFALEGLGDSLRDLGRVRSNVNPNLQLLGVALSKVKPRLRLVQKIRSYIQENFNVGGVQYQFQTEIGSSTKVPTAQDAGTTVLGMFPTHKVAEQYRALAEEVEQRFALLERQQVGEGSSRIGGESQEVVHG